MMGITAGLGAIAVCLKDVVANLTVGGEVGLSEGKDTPLARVKAPAKKRVGDGICILCGERPAQKGADVCWLCEQEDVGTAIIHTMPNEEVP